MPTPPSLEDIQAYLVSVSAVYDETDVEDAYNAELVDQANRCKFPADPAEPADPLPYPTPLARALKRRVHRNLAMGALPLGYQQTITDVAAVNTRVGSDSEINRLEGPYRKRLVG